MPRFKRGILVIFIMPESTGLESRILMTKNPADFRTRQVRIARDGNQVYILPEGPEIDFRTMGSYRKPVPVDVIQKEIDSPEGHLFANLGVSAYLVLAHKGDDYLVTVGQIRKSEGFSDKVAKLLSGYISAEFLNTPEDAILNEVSEEFLPMTWSGKFIPGYFYEENLPQPYKDIAEYAKESEFSLWASSNNSKNTDCNRAVFIDKKPVICAPRIYYHANVNGAQLVFPLKAEIFPGLAGISHAETAFLRHAEEKFEKGVLNAYMDPMPLYLLKLENNKPNGEVFTFLNGKLEPVDASGLVLSEAFVPSVHDGIIGANNITLKDYLAQK
jgi:hypothetical protein